MKKLTYAFIAFLAFVCVPLCAQSAGRKPTVVIVPFEAKGSGIGQDDCDIVTESFESEYARTGNAVVVNRSTLKKIQTEQAFQNSDWSNNDKTAKLGEALNAQQIVSGQLRLYSDLLFVTVQVQDIKTLAVLASVNVRTKSIMELLDTIPKICKDIAAQISGEVADTPVEKREWKVGEKGPGGGWIFYASISGFPVYTGDKMTICHYLECSPDIVGDRATWCSCSSKPWCNVKTYDNIGMGKQNTVNIVSASHSGGALYVFNCAAKACLEYSTEKTKAGDWFLPNKAELNLIYENLVKTGIIKSDRWHWSSSQLNDYRACYQRFSSGVQGNDYNNKDNNYCVRAVRAF